MKAYIKTLQDYIIQLASTVRLNPDKRNAIPGKRPTYLRYIET